MMTTKMRIIIMTDPIGNSPIHCSDITNSCYIFGHDLGYSRAENGIIRCHLISIPSSSGYPSRFQAGFHAG
jgi:hypothetical protein